ncbi:MAG: hypothetical protein C0394_01525 [Syntrophus sp. (in: bacteria)]|nr:hypothetical protein [Syntrophus sp. (in: bacteria)]
MMNNDDKFRDMIESMCDLVFTVDLKGMFAYVNPAFAMVTGHTVAGLIGRPFTDVIAPEARESAVAHFRRGVKSRKWALYEIDITHKDGGRIPVEFNVITRLDQNNEPAGRYGIGRDITKRRRAEEALRESEEKYRLITENMIDVITIMDMNLRVTFVSPSIMRLRGFTAEEAMAQNLEQILTPESLKFIGRIYEEEMQREASGTADPDRIQIVELQEYRKDMSLVWVEASLSFLRDADRRPVGILSLSRDITERRRVEEALRESRELEQSILLSVPHGLFGVENRRILFANDAMEDVFGWKPEELIGKSTRVIFRTDQEWEEYGAMLYSRLKTQQAWVFESDRPFVRKDGKEIFCRMSVSRTGRELGESRRIVATFEDITDRRRAEEALRESERRLTDIIEFLPDATLVIDREGKVVAWNRAMEAMTGVGKEAMIGKGDYEYALPLYGHRRPILIDLALHPDEKIEAQYTALQRTGDILFGEAYTPMLSPGNIHLSGSASVLRDLRGAIIGAIQCMRNNTERKQIEGRLAQARKMEALGLLAGGVAHDLNNVLGVLVGYSELMLHDMDKNSRFRKHAQSILTAGERAAVIVRDMLALARRGVHTAEVIDLNRTVQDYLHSPEYGNICAFHANCRIRVEIEHPLLRIKGSSAHLGKVLANLVLNAAEAMPVGGEVIIGTHNRYLDRPLRGYVDVQAGDYVVLSVADTGQGISEEDMRRIFEPFYTKKVMGRSGTGLGLAVVWGTVKDHEGYIDVESRLGEGTTFSLYFPVTREELQQDAPVPVVAFMGRGEAILVGDDVKEQRELAVQMLGRLDYRVTAVASGEDAVDYLKTSRPDLVILDMIMDPGMDGLDTYRKIIEMHPRQKAIIVSGYAETDRVREAQKLGAGAYVRKPYILERLGMAVRQELDRREHVPPASDMTGA